MPCRSRPSLQEIHRKRQQSGFMGRGEQLQQFRSTLDNPIADYDGRFFKYLIFNIWGQGGVGKTTLVKQFRHIAEHLQRPIAVALFG